MAAIVHEKVGGFMKILDIFYKNWVNWSSSGSKIYQINIILKIFRKNISKELQNGDTKSQKMCKI